MFLVTLKNARFNASVGLYDEEVPLRNEIEVDITVSLPADIRELPLIDYALLYEVAANAVGAPVKLLESILEKILAGILAIHEHATIDVCVRKLNPPMGGQVAYAEVRFLHKGRVN